MLVGPAASAELRGQRVREKVQKSQKCIVEVMTIIEQLENRRGTMRLSQFAQLLEVSYDTVYKWVRSCGLPATKIAGTYWIDPRMAAQWWRSHSTT